MSAKLGPTDAFHVTSESVEWPRWLAVQLGGVMGGAAG